MKKLLLLVTLMACSPRPPTEADRMKTTGRCVTFKMKFNTVSYCTKDGVGYFCDGDGCVPLMVLAQPAEACK